MSEEFYIKSYELHEKLWELYVDGAERSSHAKTWLKDDTVDHWRHYRMYNNIDPIIESYPNSFWLTVGDGRYGNDAHYIMQKGAKALATDISDILLKEAKDLGFIDNFKP